MKRGVQLMQTHSPAHLVGIYVPKFTEAELRQFERAIKPLSSPNQMVRISARLNLTKLIEKFGQEKCGAMNEALLERDRKLRDAHQHNRPGAATGRKKKT